MKPRKGCWTCKARRIKCDEEAPNCQNCARSQRQCQGYELRLSWPKGNNRKRAITGRLPPTLTHPRQSTVFQFINTTFRDVELYRHLSLHMQPPPPPVVPTPDSWILPQGGADYAEILEYFHNSAYLSLVTFTAEPHLLRDVLIRMALIKDTVPGYALLYALLAYSSLHRSGIHKRAVQLKVSAIHSLADSARERPLDPMEAFQHVAASMVLAAFEILVPSESSGGWLWYLWGAIDTIQATQLVDRLEGSDLVHLIDWVYYHNALSRFPLQHWQHKSLSLDTVGSVTYDFRGRRYPSLTSHKPLPISPFPTHAILNLLCEICDTMLDPNDPRCLSEEYQDSITALEKKLETIPTRLVSAEHTSRSMLLVELYQRAARTYLLRASQNAFKAPTKLESYIDEAFNSRRVDAPSCAHLFPLFIVACEARTEERRSAIISLIDRTERSIRPRSMAGLRARVQSIWIQQDLHADGDLLVNYLGIMNMAISSSNTLPSIV